MDSQADHGWDEKLGGAGDVADDATRASRMENVATADGGVRRSSPAGVGIRCLLVDRGALYGSDRQCLRGRQCRFRSHRRSRVPW